MEAENFVENYLIHNHIPYKRNMKLKNNAHQTIAEFDFIIPNAIIEVKSGCFKISEHNKAVNKLLIQLRRIRNNIPNNYKIYLFSVKILSDDVINLIKECHNDVIIIYDLKKLEINNYPYATRDTGVLRSFVSEYNDKYNYYKSLYDPLYVPKSIYNRVIIGMTNNQLMRLNDMNIYIVNEIPNDCVYISGRKLNNLDGDKLFKVFNEIIPYYDIIYAPIMLIINGVSEWCCKCDKIKYLECFDNNICTICLGNGSSSRNKRKRELDPNMIPINTKKQKVNL